MEARCVDTQGLKWHERDRVEDVGRECGRKRKRRASMRALWQGALRQRYAAQSSQRMPCCSKTAAVQKCAHVRTMWVARRVSEE